MHSDLSNGITNIGSVTKYKEYVDYASSLGMTALGFSEHGNIFEWVHKKEAIETAGMKYLHGSEVYLTTDKDVENKSRDNYHCVLIAKNYDGVKELNKLISNSFNRNDYHYYYAPRISFDELFNTSDNIIVTSACLGGVLGKAKENIKAEFLKFLIKNKHRCYLEIQHHNCEAQATYNEILYAIHQKTGIPLIAGTDTHCLNDSHVEGRSILQKGNNYNALDTVNIKAIQKLYGTKKIDKLKFISSYEKVINNKMGIMIEYRPLNYIDYNRERAFRELKEFCGFEYYGGKHLENILTAFVQLYWLPKKFNFDKRTSHLSSMIVSGQLTREEALEILEKPLYDEVLMNGYIEKIKQSIGISDEEFDDIMIAEKHEHTDYKTDRIGDIIRKIVNKQRDRKLV